MIIMLILFEENNVFLHSRSLKWAKRCACVLSSLMSLLTVLTVTLFQLLFFFVIRNSKSCSPMNDCVMVLLKPAIEFHSRFKGTCVLFRLKQRRGLQSRIDCSTCRLDQTPIISRHTIFHFIQFRFPNFKKIILWTSRSLIFMMNTHTSR